MCTTKKQTDTLFTDHVLFCIAHEQTVESRLFSSTIRFISLYLKEPCYEARRFDAWYVRVIVDVDGVTNEAS